MDATRRGLNELDNGETSRRIAAPVKSETRTATATAAAAKPARRSRKPWLGAGLAVLGLAALWGAHQWWNYAHTWVTTDNAYVAGHIHTVSTRVTGNVSEVLVSENQDVEAGAVLARLDPSDLKVQREKAHATLAQAEAQLAQARAQVTRDTAVATKTQLDFDRSDRLIREANSAISKQEFDNARATLDAARASLEATQAAVLAAEAQVRAATAQLKDVELQLSYMEILSPVAGRIGRKNLEAGNRVQAGQALLAVVQPQVWVVANFKETQLAPLKPGQAVRLNLDSFPGRDFAGRVQSLAPASGAQFALLPPDNATGNFTKIVQRVPVKIVFDEDGLRGFAGSIVPGMSVLVKVNVRGEGELKP